MMMPSPEKTALLIVLGYLIGSIPTSIWTVKLAKGFDIRTRGSGNAGATNVFRVCGWKLTLIVAAVDIFKGIMVVFLSRRIVGEGLEIPVILCGIAAILGHVYTVFAGFKGGKGILVSLGIFISLEPFASLSSFAVWAAVVAITRYVSVSSMLAAVLLPIFTYFYRKFGFSGSGQAVQWFTVVVAVFVVFTHRSNIRRLIKGTENRFGSKKESV